MKIKTFIINMTEDIDRKQYMSKECEKFSNILDIEFIDAIDGRLLENTIIEEYYDEISAFKKLGRGLKLGEIGCCLSHIQIYKKIIEEKLEYCLILEDDVIIDKNLSKFLEQIDSLHIRWELILLGHYSCYIDSIEISSPVSIWNQYKLRQGYKLCRLLDYGYGTHGYIINRKGTEKLLEHLKTFYMPIDHYTANRKILNVFSLLPTLVKVNTNFDSNINQTKRTKSLIKDSIIIRKIRNIFLSLMADRDY